MGFQVSCHGVHGHSKHSTKQKIKKGFQFIKLDTFFSSYIQQWKDALVKSLSDYDKKQQAYFGALLVSTPSLPIMLLLVLFKVRNLSVLNNLAAFASGSLIGDVFLHNMPEIMASKSKVKLGHYNNVYLREALKFLLEKEVLFCFGIIAFFFIEKLISLLTSDSKKSIVHSHNHHHSSSLENQKKLNIWISILGDTLHNVTDGLAIGAAFSKSKDNCNLRLTTGYYSYYLDFFS